MAKKINSKALKAMILEIASEVKNENKLNERKSQLKKIMKNARVVLEDASPSGVDPERFPLKLSDAAKSAGEEAERKVTGGDDDGAKGDDEISAEKDTRPCKDLKPSQTSMDINKACAFAIAAIRQVEPFETGPGGDLGAIITSDNHIMDGHHRWIASGMVDPTSEVGGFIVEFPAKQMIAALNMITVKLGITKGKEGSGDFKQFNEEGIKAQLEEFARSGIWSADGEPAKVIEACEKFSGASGAAAIGAAAAKMAKNVAQLTLSVPAGFPERPDMPVISKKKGHLQVAIDLLRSGQVDLNEPYATDEADVKESKSSQADLIVERWNKLAGLLK